MNDNSDKPLPHYLRVEAVGFRSFIEDTSDLNTIRGGGLIVLEAARAVARKWLVFDESRVKDCLVASEASIAVLELGELSPSRARELRNALADWLVKEPDYQDAVFVVDIVGSQGEYGRDLQRLVMTNRLRQLREPSLVFPEWQTHSPRAPSNRNSPAWPACEEDRVRPVVPGRYNDQEADAKRQWISRATATRRRVGKDAKKGFYIREAKLSEREAEAFSHGFSWDFHQLCSKPPKGAEHLGGKLAVIHADGNGFGKVLTSVAKNPKEHRRFAREVNEHRRGYLATLLQMMRAAEQRWHGSCQLSLPADGDGGLETTAWRLEVLLWGGDEFMLVVPAWQGWETLRLFFDCCSPPGTPGLHFRSGNQIGEPQKVFPLKYAAGLVFAHHKAPFHHVSDLARNLCGLAKSDRTRNAYACAVLESFDNFGTSIEETLLRQGLVTADDRIADLFTFPGEGMGVVEDEVRALKTERPDFPHSRIHEMARLGLLRNQSETKLPPQLAPFSARIANLQTRLGGGALWLHLASLWDYIAVEEVV